MPETPFDRIWNAHVIKDYGDGRCLIHVDRHFVHEGSSGRAFDGLRQAGLPVRRKDLTFGVIDHGISTLPGRTIESWPPTRNRNLQMQRNCEEFDVRLFDVGDPHHGIVHVVAPHLGIALPGCTYVCGDSHTASCGGLGAWAWGIGTTEVMQVLATQALVQRKPKALAVPGSAQVKAAAEAAGLHQVFIDAGFEWREAGCSMCVAAGGDMVPRGQRSISTSNRNFEGRQGPGSRTHLASPAMVAAAAIAGHITDVRRLIG